MTEKSGLLIVTLPIVLYVNCWKVKDIINTVNELKESLIFSQKDIDDAKSNISKIETKITKADEDISEAYGDI